MILLRIERKRDEHVSNERINNVSYKIVQPHRQEHLGPKHPQQLSG
jgi:hypothetical protein